MDDHDPSLPSSKNGWLPLTSQPSSLTPTTYELPPFPPNQRPQPMASKTSPMVVPQIPRDQPLTPPSTPSKHGSDRSSASMTRMDAMLSVGMSLGTVPPEFLRLGEQVTNPLTWRQDIEPRPYTGQYELHEELGRGAWSIVYRASEANVINVALQSIAARLPPSPPSSPSNKPMARRTLAVKKPIRTNAHDILLKEACVLTYLHSHPEASSYLVPFVGFDSMQNSIILESIPLSLETFTKCTPKSPFTTKSMFDPIIGTQKWTHLAESLIGGLSFLHSTGCVHGDIKPANILLRPERFGNEELVPLYCDFSSSRMVSPTIPQDEVEEVSAVTTEYTSPELLNALQHRSVDRAVATFASDVFALAVTLLFVAIGESPYACARIEIQKLVMAREGLPLEFARRGGQASRVMNGKMIAESLKGGLERSVERRLSVTAWRNGFWKAIKIWKDGV